MGLTNWIKKNFILVIILLLGVYLAFDNRLLLLKDSINYGYQTRKTGSSVGVSTAMDVGIFDVTDKIVNPNSMENYPTQANSPDRLVIKESSLSLLVTNVVETRKKIIFYAQSIGGYMVSANTTNPDSQAFAEVIVRVPAEKLEEAINTYRSLGIKVVSENLYGYDVTDQYVDIEKRISQQEKVLEVYEKLLNQATQVSDISSITKQILSTQEQIDSLKGQQYALEQNSKLSKLTIYLSTDEIALPYTPDEAFRPQIIFKNAVRSMIGLLRGIAAFIIWAGVYAVIWVPALLIFLFGRKMWQNKINSSKNKILS